jgi:hypothetical protein
MLLSSGYVFLLKLLAPLIMTLTTGMAIICTVAIMMRAYFSAKDSDT